MPLPPTAKIFDLVMGFTGPVYAPNDDLGAGSACFRFSPATPGNAIRSFEWSSSLGGSYASFVCDPDGSGGFSFTCLDGAFFNGPITSSSFITGILSGNDISAGSLPLTAHAPQAAWTMVANATAGSAAPTAVALRALPTYLAFSGNLGALTFTASGQACLTSVTLNGAVLLGRGTTYDVRLGNQSGVAALSVPANTANVLLHGNCTLDAVGRGYGLRSGRNARAGTATLVGGTVTVANTSVTSTTQILLTAQSTGGTAGALRISAKVVGTSFTITSTSATDTSTVFYMLVEVTP